MKVSIVTVVYNAVWTLQQAIESVLEQDYPNIEYIIVDGGSKDGTVEVLEEYRSRISVLISEKDEGLYDAMNKGIKTASGDILGILNADDFFYDNQVISKVVEGFFKNEGTDAVLGDVVFIKHGSLNKVVRKYSSAKWRPSKFAWGFMPSHPSFFVKTKLFDTIGYYKTNYKISADYELLIRFLYIYKIRWTYLPIVTTKMRIGGTSTNGLRSMLTLNREIIRGCRENGIYTNYLMIYSKYLFKPWEFIFKS